MKKVMLSIALAAMTLTAMAQKTVPYFRVEFTQDISQVASTMKDPYIFYNTDHQYLDFRGPQIPLTCGSTTVTESSSFYIGEGPNKKTPFLVDRIKKISAYQQEVRTIKVDSTAHFATKGETGGNWPDACTFTFSDLPRNVEELQTIDRKYFDSPWFVAALCIAVAPRIADCSDDVWAMFNYLRLHDQQAGLGGLTEVPNKYKQDICTMISGKDGGGFPKYQGCVFGAFDGATAFNGYTPDKPYKVTVIPYKPNPWNTISGNIVVGNFCYICHGVGEEMPQGPIVLRQTKNHGWLLHSEEPVIFKTKQDQVLDL